MKKLCSLLCVMTLSLLLFAVLSTSVNATPPTSGEYTIELLSSVYTPEWDEQNWTYKITCISDPGVSHVLFETKTVCDPPLDRIDSAGGAAEIEWMYTPDPTTGKVGLKFEDFPTSDGSIQAGEEVIIWFATDGQWPVGTIEVWIKAAGNIESFIVDGPDCIPHNQIPEIPFGSVMAGTSMLVASVAYFALRKRKQTT